MQPITPIQIASPDGYQPGVCNIGPAEIARRRNFGHVALAADRAMSRLIGIWSGVIGAAAGVVAVPLPLQRDPRSTISCVPYLG